MRQEDLDRLPWGPKTYQGFTLLILIINIGLMNLFLTIPILQNWPVSSSSLWIIAILFGAPSLIIASITIYGIQTIQRGKPFSFFPFATKGDLQRSPIAIHRHILGSLLLTLTWATVQYYFLMGTHYFGVYAPIVGLLMINLALYTFQPDLFRISADAQPITLPWTYLRYKLLLLLALIPGLISIGFISDLLMEYHLPEVSPGIHLFLLLFSPITIQYLLYPLEHGVSPLQTYRWDLTSHLGRLRIHRYLQAILLGQATWGFLAAWNQWYQYIPWFNLLILLITGGFLAMLLLAILTPIREPPNA